MVEKALKESALDEDPAEGPNPPKTKIVSCFIIISMEHIRAPNTAEPLQSSILNLCNMYVAIPLES